MELDNIIDKRLEKTIEINTGMFVHNGINDVTIHLTAYENEAYEHFQKSDDEGYQYYEGYEDSETQCIAISYGALQDLMKLLKYHYPSFTKELEKEGE